MCIMHDKLHAILKCLLIATLLAGAANAIAATGDVCWARMEGTYYKDYPLFDTYARETEPRQPVEHFGPVGIGIDLLQPAFTMRVRNVEKGSPAAATGKFKPGQMIESINGQVLQDIDPRIILGGIITQAEATDGVVKFMLKASAADNPEEVIVKIPVLGAYSKTWPLNCPKSARIVRNEADYLTRSGNFAVPDVQGLGLLFLLSTGETQDLTVAAGWVKELVAKHKDAATIDSIPWHIGYGGPALCEYYLRTGDASILPLIEKLAERAKQTMYNGGWNHRDRVNFRYGHMNAAGVHCVTFLLLAKECGVKVDEATLQESLRHFYRFAGHGNVAYGDNLPESGFVDNGKTGGLAFEMAAAASLTPEGEASVYAGGRDVSAVKGFYATSWMLHGHTGGGIGEIWRSASMGLMYDKKPAKYREFMDNRQWFYELSRRFDGSMGIVSATIGDGEAYDNPARWGIGLALSYTIPRKTLRLSGAPATKFCQTYALPKQPWGTVADAAFVSLAPAPDALGKVQDVDAERLATDAAWPISRRVNEFDVTNEVLLIYAHHPDQGVRQMAAMAICKQGRDPLIVALLKDKDPRARQAGTMAIASYSPMKGKGSTMDPARLTDEMVALLLGLVNDPQESWWVVENALTDLGMARPELLAPHVERLCFWLQQDDWWLRKAALTALTGVAADERFYQQVLPLIGRMVVANRSNQALGPLAGIVAKLQEAKPAVQALALQVFGQAYADYPKHMAAPGGIDMAEAVTGLVRDQAQTLANLPGGFDALYTLAAKRFPDQSLPHKELFLAADPERLGARVAQVMQPTILQDLIPEHIARNRKNVLALAAAEMQSITPGGSTDALDQLVELYRRGGDTNDCDWHVFGPDRLHNEWAYVTFHPPEKMEWDASYRYRKVTLPAGMSNWYATNFEAEKAGWRKGFAPFGCLDGKLQAGACTCPVCGCGDQPNTLWDKEVLLMRRVFELPPLRKNCRYRLLVGGSSHVGAGDGFRVYLNGRKLTEEKGPRSRNSGGQPKGAFITRDWFNEFQSGKVVVAATGFLGSHKKKKSVPNGNLNIWFEEMKLPPMGEDVMRKSVQALPMCSAAWQVLQDPNKSSEDPEAGKFTWDGVMVANPPLPGAWTPVGQVAAVEEFVPGKPHPVTAIPPLTFLANGETSQPLWHWSGNILMDLEKLQALQMTHKMIDGADYLFVEAGGFSEKQPVGWKAPLVVMKRGGDRK